MADWLAGWLNLRMRMGGGGEVVFRIGLGVRGWREMEWSRVPVRGLRGLRGEGLDRWDERGIFGYTFFIHRSVR